MPVTAMEIAHEIEENSAQVLGRLVATNYGQPGPEWLTHLAVVSFEGDRFIGATNRHMSIFFRAPDDLERGTIEGSPTW